MRAAVVRPSAWSLRIGFAMVLASWPTKASFASGGLEVPDAGSLQVGRGGAWVARADDPLAAYMNPAAMSYQSHGVHLGAHVMIQNGCFARVNEEGEPVSPGNAIPGPGAPNGPEAETCTTAVFPNPQLAAVFRVYEGLSIGIALLGPHATGNIDWGESVPFTIAGSERTQPSPNRYLLVSQQSIVVFPTISVSYPVIPDVLSVGAGFVWGISHANFTTFTESTSSSREDDFNRDVKAEITAADYFVPGIVVGANWRATKRVDIGAWFHWSDAIRTEAVELKLLSNYWLAGGQPNEAPCPTNDPECNLTHVEEAGSFKLQIPMEAKLGVRYHHPLTGQTKVPGWAVRSDKGFVRDPLTQDLFDVEVDLSWANNSAVDQIEIQFHEGIDVKGTPGEVPQDGNIPHRWSDVLGVRWGADVTAVPNLLALRAGGWFESKGQRDSLLNLDFHMGWKAGINAGGTVRLGPADISLAYQHVFYGTLDNGGQGEVKALSGDASTGFRSQQAVNGGSFSQMLDEVAAGVTFRF